MADSAAHARSPPGAAPLCGRRWSGPGPIVVAGSSSTRDLGWPSRPSTPASCAGATWCSELRRRVPGLAPGMVDGLRRLLMPGRPARRPATCRARSAALTLVDDDTIEREIVTSRLALAVMDRASWDSADLRSRVAGSLEGAARADAHDLLRAHVLARIALRRLARPAGSACTGWRELQVLHEEFAPGRGGLPRDQPLMAGRAARAARGRPAPVHPPVARTGRWAQAPLGYGGGRPAAAGQVGRPSPAFAGGRAPRWCGPSRRRSPRHAAASGTGPAAASARRRG